MTIYRLKGASGPVANQAVALSGVTLIGTAADCDLVIPEGGVAPRHAEIRATGSGGLRLTRLEGAEVRVNGKPVDQAVLASGDEIRIGACRWVLQAPGLRPEKVLTAAATRRRRNHLPWLIPLALFAAATLAWQRGWLPFT